ncbi:hypothetical protein [Streptococcus cristatus]|uniref:hypothetical protein n=1 Tax=Streptococcus cristatus TaxID=45634 RepID=UPI0028D3D34C|nr:hypothetical protein [Streptococcus cristatus]
MKIINSISSIYPTEVNFNLNRLEDKFFLNTEIELQVSIKIEELQKGDEQNYRATVAFLLRHSSDENEVDIMKISHLVEFISLVETFNLKEKEFNFALFEIVEPYVRFRFNELISQTKLSSLELPYRFWELVNNESEISN